MMSDPLDFGVRVAQTRYGHVLINPMPMLAKASYELGRHTPRSKGRRLNARKWPHRKGAK